MRRERSNRWCNAQPMTRTLLQMAAAILLSLEVGSCNGTGSSTIDDMNHANSAVGTGSSTLHPAQPTIARAVTTTPSDPGDGVYVLDWERDGDDPAVGNLPANWNHHFNPGRATVVDSPVPQPHGKRSVRFELHSNEAANTKWKMRSELAASPSEKPYADRWYGFSIYLPENWVSTDKGEILTQWHQNRNTGSPPLAIMTLGDQWVIDRKRWDTDNNETTPTRIGKFVPGQWTDWILHVWWSKDDGVIEIWKDGIKDENKVFTQPGGQTAYEVKEGETEDAVANYMKFGIYKWTWPDNSNPPRVIWMCHDEVRTANGPANRLKDVAPPSLLPPPTETITLTPLVGENHFVLERIELQTSR